MWKHPENLQSYLKKQKWSIIINIAKVIHIKPVSKVMPIIFVSYLF